MAQDPLKLDTQLLGLENTMTATDETALLAATREHPAEDTPRLMLADWYEEHDKAPLAEFIRVQIAFDAALREWGGWWISRRASEMSERQRVVHGQMADADERQQELFSTHGRDWFGEYAVLAPPTEAERQAVCPQCVHLSNPNRIRECPACHGACRNRSAWLVVRRGFPDLLVTTAAKLCEPCGVCGGSGGDVLGPNSAGIPPGTPVATCSSCRGTGVGGLAAEVGRWPLGGGVVLCDREPGEAWNAAGDRWVRWLGVGTLANVTHPSFLPNVLFRHLGHEHSFEGGATFRGYHAPDLAHLALSRAATAFARRAAGVTKEPA